MSPGGRRTGRRPGSADTRGRILDAARAAFGERGYDGASVRQIAADAGVDPALVHHYFGPKQRLFVAAMTFPVDPAVALPRLLAAGPREELGERFVRFVVALWDRPDVRPLVAGVVRSAATDPVAATMARRLLTEGPLLAIATATSTCRTPRSGRRSRARSSWASRWRATSSRSSRWRRCRRRSWRRSSGRRSSATSRATWGLRSAGSRG